jgi:hypothetical protein
MDFPRVIEYNITINFRKGRVDNMAGGRALTETEIMDITNFISLKQFPPKLRKLATFLLESDTPVTICEACKALKLNLDSIYTMIARCRRKGNDFNEFINEQSQMLLKSNRIGVYQAVIQQAVAGTSTSHNQQKLFASLVGDAKDDMRINTSITLAIGINVTGVTPQDDRAAGQIDCEPVIPVGK